MDIEPMLERLGGELPLKRETLEALAETTVSRLGSPPVEAIRRRVLSPFHAIGDGIDALRLDGRNVIAQLEATPQFYHHRTYFEFVFGGSKGLHELASQVAKAMAPSLGLGEAAAAERASRLQKKIQNIVPFPMGIDRSDAFAKFETVLRDLDTGFCRAQDEVLAHPLLSDPKLKEQLRAERASRQPIELAAGRAR